VIAPDDEIPGPKFHGIRIKSNLVRLRVALYRDDGQCRTLPRSVQDHKITQTKVTRSLDDERASVKAIYSRLATGQEGTPILDLRELGCAPHSGVGGHDVCCKL